MPLLREQRVLLTHERLKDGEWRADAPAAVLLALLGLDHDRPLLGGRRECLDRRRAASYTTRTAGDEAGNRELSLLVVRASQRSPIESVCAHAWLKADSGEAPLPLDGTDGPGWDEAVAARLEAYGCPKALVQHHVGAGAANHVTASYEVLVHAEHEQASGSAGGAAA